MSYITDAVVVVDYATEDAERRLIEPLPFDKIRHQGFREIDMDAAGGTKVFCSKVYAAALNFISASDLEDWFRGLPWGGVSDAVLVWNTEGEQHGTVVIAAT